MQRSSHLSPGRWFTPCSELTSLNRAWKIRGTSLVNQFKKKRACFPSKAQLRKINSTAQKQTQIHAIARSFFEVFRFTRPVELWRIGPTATETVRTRPRSPRGAASIILAFCKHSSYFSHLRVSVFHLPCHHSQELGEVYRSVSICVDLVDHVRELGLGGVLA